MPYYCTVPRCTSMAGKAKNVSFHQFPRDEELAKLWNDILKRGKPYTKYSKVCSLHFKPEDYTITSAGKNKGQWRTLRKDAIPSQNLPSDTPAPYTRRQSGAWVPNNVPTVDPQMENQARNLAQAIYMQTMLAMQAAGLRDPAAMNTLCNGLPQTPPEDLPPHSSTTTEQVNTTSQDLSTNHNLSQDLRTNHNLNQDLRTNHNLSQDLRTNHNLSQDLRTNHNSSPDTQNKTSFQCEECSKCFKDPDVFVLHQRSHTDTGKENFDLNTLKPEMLKSNPILANLLRTTMERNIFTKSLFEKQLMVSFSNMENYLRSVNNYEEECDNSDLSESLDDNLVIDENVA